MKTRVVWGVGGLLLGLLLGVSLGPRALDPSPVVHSSEGSSETLSPSGSAVIPTLASTGTAEAPTVPGVPRSEPSSFPDAATGGSAPALRPTASIEVMVRVPEGSRRIAGEVYVLPEGASGVVEYEWENDILLCEARAGEPVVLPWLSAEPCHAYFRWDGGVVRSERLVPRVGESTEVTLTVLTGSIQIDRDAFLDQPGAADLILNVTAYAVSAGSHEGQGYPSDPASFLDSVGPYPGGDPFRIDYLQLGRSYDVRARVYHREKGRAIDAPWLAVRCVPARAQAGESVRVELLEGAPLDVDLPIDWERWPPVRCAPVHVEVLSHEQLLATRILAPNPYSRTPEMARFVLPEGRYTVRWRGDQILSGSADVEHRADVASRVEALMVYAHPEETSDPVTAFEVGWPSEFAGDEVDKHLEFYAAHPRTGELLTYDVMDQTNPIFPSREVLDSRRWIAFDTETLTAASEVVVDADGRARLTMQPAGLLVLVPTRLSSWTEGSTLMVARAGGGPLPTWQEDFERVLRAPVGKGGIQLGPLAPGPLRLEVWQGRSRLETFTAHIRAGQVEVRAIGK